MADIIKVEHLSYVYNPGLPTAVTALDDVSFTVEEGDFVGIIGATGSGKSTLITHMNGLNKPTSGKIYIDGRDLWADPEKIRDFRFLTGLVFQYPEYQPFEETCYKDIAFGPKNMGLDEAEVDRRVHEAADFVGLDPALLERSPFELSGGQKRRVAVAGVMAMKPRILVLDEPAAGLDPEGRDDILSEVKEYHKKTGTTVLLVSHSMEDIAKYANRVLVMSNKKIAMYDTVEKVFARAPELLELGLSVPQVTKIFLKLREMGVDVPADVYTIPYAVKTLLEAKRRRDAGESLVLPRSAAQKGSDAARYHHRSALPGQQSGAPVRPQTEACADRRLYRAAVCSVQPLGAYFVHPLFGGHVQGGKNSGQDDRQKPEAHPAHRAVHGGAEPVLCFRRGRPAGAFLVLDHLRRGRALRGADGGARDGADRGHQPAYLHHQPHRADRCH